MDQMGKRKGRQTGVGIEVPEVPEVPEVVEPEVIDGILAATAT